MRLILIRHAQTLWNLQHKTQGLSDTQLSTTGEEQAQNLASHMGDYHASRVYTSPLQRAYQTAHPIARFFNCPIAVDEGIIEIKFGDWEGLTFDEIGETYPKELQLWNKEPLSCRIPGDAESIAQVAMRIDGFISRLKLLHAKQTVIVVTHTVPAKIIVAKALGLPLNNIHLLRLDNASISIID